MTETDKACCKGIPPIPGCTPAEIFLLILSAQAHAAMPRILENYRIPAAQSAGLL